MNIIETRALSRSYGKRRAVDNLDMHVAAGEIYGFVGKNGAGKSTAMKMIAGLVNPSSGSIELFGTQPRAQRSGQEFSRVGALIEDPGILPTFSALENLMCKAIAIGVVRPDAHCRELLELVGLDDTGATRVKKFSLGMKQRLGLALALVGGPDLLLLDEPFNGLDPESTRKMRNALVRLNRERGVTMVISSHVLDQLDRMATSFGVIRSGHMVRELSVDELHQECGSSIRVRTSDPARALAILEEELPGAALRAEPDGSIIASAPARHAAARFGGAAADPASNATPSPEDIARTLTDHGQLILELAHVERDIEEYFVELMGGADA
ncbi:ABC transporter ATP-binding protein [Collinsella sp. D33t1_170424_A12]|uniref:ABC transporter ATP-binding protein n=1 Tax=Collinsella sp. D33t1_170424_A12 TaxID=2787135 RepID=UPI00189B19DE|nr:ATP-binding cassette domain-containing protein [Collinsella sp. D33t1_170424_A12]